MIAYTRTFDSLNCSVSSTTFPPIAINMPYKADSVAARRASGAARSRKYYANLKARLEQITGLPQASRKSNIVPPSYDCADRLVLSFTHGDWVEGKVKYRRFANPDLNSRSTVILVMTPQRESQDLQLIDSDRLPQSVTRTPSHLKSYWYHSEQGELEKTQPGTSDSSETPERP